MGILTSLISLGIVVGLGYYTIKYIIPKIESGEFDLGLGTLTPAAAATPDTTTDTGIGGTADDDDDVSSILSNLADTVGLPTDEGVVTPEDDIALPAVTDKPATKTGKKGKGDYLKSDLAGKDNRKTGAKSGGSRRKKKGGGSSSDTSSSKTSSGSKKSSKSKDADEEEDEVEEIEKETIYFYYNNVYDGGYY